MYEVIAVFFYFSRLQSFEDGPIAMPFVCVDEINQGMDENNEKNVWSLILDSCRRKQLMYFTPTLSERLNIADAPVTIHVTSNWADQKIGTAQEKPIQVFVDQKHLGQGQVIRLHSFECIYVFAI